MSVSDRTMPVTGPHRVYVQRTPVGVELDVSHLVEQLVLGLAELFAADPQGMAEEMVELDGLNASSGYQLSHGNDDSPATHERDRRVEELLSRLGGAVVTVYGDQVRKLAEQLLAAAGEPVAVTAAVAA